MLFLTQRNLKSRMVRILANTPESQCLRAQSITGTDMHVPKPRTVLSFVEVVISRGRVHLKLVTTMATSITLLHMRLISASCARRMSMVAVTMTKLVRASTIWNRTERLRPWCCRVRALHVETMLIGRTSPACSRVVIACYMSASCCRKVRLCLPPGVIGPTPPY